LDKLLNINDKDSLILCYYGEILKNLGKYNEAVTYFTKANNIDPENIHNLNKRVIAYFVLQEYDKALLDIDKVIQLDPSNSLAYYNKGLTYYTIGNNENAIIAFKRCIELDSNDNLSKMQLYYVEYSQKNDYKNLKYDVITKVGQIPNIDDDNSLLFMKCKLNIEFEQYDVAMLDLSRLFYNYKEISFVYLLQEYQGFWSYLYKVYKTNHDYFVEFGIVDKFNKYMYTGERI
jgi:tetratricopeptide (TPR) repeat protein